MDGDALPEGWRWVTLAEVADPNSRAIVSGPFGSNIGSRFFVEDGVPVIRGNNLTTDAQRFIDDGFAFVTDEKANELRNCDAIADDLVFTAAGSLGQVGLIPKSARFPRYIISNKQLRARVDKGRVDPLFAFYWFSSREMVAYVQQRNTGSSVPLINLSVLRSLPLPLPPLPEQRAIAHILGTLDNKIELNRRMSETLEAMARTLFKSWFVDFDAVRAKAEGRWKPGQSLPGLPANLFDLFSDRLVDSELGEIPEGWEERALDEIADYVNGAACQKYAIRDGEAGLPVIKIRELNQGVSEQTDRVRRDFPEQHRANDGDVLFSWSGTLLCKIWTGGTGFVNQHVFKVSSDEYPRWLYLYWTQHHLDVFRGVAADKATTMGHIKREHLRNAKALVPPNDLLDAMTTNLEPFVQRQIQIDLESRDLERMRDALLPKLISGGLHARDMNPLLEFT